MRCSSSYLLVCGPGAHYLFEEDRDSHGCGGGFIPGGWTRWKACCEEQRLESSTTTTALVGNHQMIRMPSNNRTRTFLKADGLQEEPAA